MLTAETEGGQLKCHPYWSGKEYGNMKLKALSEKRVSLDPTKHRVPADRRELGRRRANTSAESSPPFPSPSDTPHVIVRKFALSHASHPFSPIREITQIHYSSWPDFGAPASPSQLLGLVELSNQIQRASSSSTVSQRSSDPEDDSARPMLVHCSAGCGRTGTFCTVDTVIDMLKRQRKEVKSGVTPMEFTSSVQSDYIGKAKDNDAKADGDWIFNQDLDLVQKTVEDFRGQRLSMVQSLRQYVLCYESVLEWMAQQYVPSRQTGRERSGSHGGVIERSHSDRGAPGRG
jgi:protein tyrosine phosphatase